MFAGASSSAWKLLCSRVSLQCLGEALVRKAKYLVDVLEAVWVAAQREIQQREEQCRDILERQVRPRAHQQHDLLPEDLEQADVFGDAAERTWLLGRLALVAARRRRLGRSVGGMDGLAGRLAGSLVGRIAGGLGVIIQPHRR